MKIYLVLIVIIISFSNLHSEDNKWQRPLHSMKLQYMAAIKGNLVVGCDDDLFVSVDGGENWSNNTNGILPYTKNIFTLGDNLVAYSVNGIAISKDKGWTWSNKFEGYCSSMIAFGDTAIVQIGNEYIRKAILRTTDAGLHWYEMNVEINPTGNFTEAIRTHNGILAGTSTGLFRTTDEGVTWRSESTPFTGSVSILQQSGQNLIAVTSEGVFRSSDDGDSWTDAPCYVNNGENERFICGTSCGNRLYLCTVDKMFYSDNGGSSWRKANASNFIAIKMYTFGDKVYLCSNGGLFEINANTTNKKSIHSGLSTLRINALTSTRSRTIAFTDNNVFYTTNSGRNWIDLDPSPPLEYIYKTVNIGDTIMAAGQDRIFRSVDGGNSWIEFYPWGQGNYTFVQDLTINGDYVYLTAKGEIFYSSDAGYTWERFSVPYIQFTSPIRATGRGGVVVIINSNYNIYLTTDSGNTWELKDSWNISNPNLLISSGDNIFIGNRERNMFISSGFGKEWKVAECGVTFVPDECQGLSIIGNKLFAYSYSSGLMCSTDFGDTWQKNMNGVKQNSVRCFSFDGTTAYLGTGTGGVYCTNFGNVSADEPVATKDEITITPNPASDAIRIQTKQMGAKGSIINSVGETVAVFVTSTGAETRVDISSLAPGVYFVVSGGNAVKFVKL